MATINLTDEQIKVLKEIVDECHEEYMTIFDRLFIKGEYIKSEKYAERASILEDIYNELNNI